MTTLTEQLAPILGQIEGLDIVLFSQQAELVAIKADQERFEQGIYAYEQTNEFIRSLLSPEHLPPSVAPTAMKPVRSIQPSGGALSFLSISRNTKTLPSVGCIQEQDCADQAS